ncbi:MAG: non-hydrolyzing UDP-N-acetylglucosamine 2-epimerase [Acidimicrobiia bacterium]
MTDHVALVAGARPNFMKVKPVLDALEPHGVPVELIHTGQHYDPQMSDVFFDELGLRHPDHHLNVGSGSHGQQTAAAMVGFEALLQRSVPRAEVVVGDVNSTVACALVASKAGALVVHVEAGLRSRDWSMPEEINRVVTDRLSDLLLAPSPDAVENPRSEGYRDDQIHLVGNVMIDTLRSNVDRARERRVAERLGLTGPYGVVTLHRPSNVDDERALALLVDAIGEVAQRCPLVFPVHPRTRAKLSGVLVPPNLHLVEPLGYLDFLGLQADSSVVITDGGGIQEEATALGVPCLTARESTERPITVSDDTNRVVGTNPVDLVKAAHEVLDDPPAPRCPALWDGHAGERVADAIIDMIRHPRWPRPTEAR